MSRLRQRIEPTIHVCLRRLGKGYRQGYRIMAGFSVVHVRVEMVEPLRTD